MFGVTEPTIRKDLSALQQRGLLKRTHGGALAVHPSVDRELPTARPRTAPTRRRSRTHACSCSGRRLGVPRQRHLGRGRRAAACPRAGEPAPLGADQQPGRRERAGGRARASTACCSAAICGASTARWSGDLALENLQRFSFSSAFLGVSGFSELGISVGSLAEASLKAAVIDARAGWSCRSTDKVGATDSRASATRLGRRRGDGRGFAAVRELCAGYDIELITAAGASQPA